MRQIGKLFNVTLAPSEPRRSKLMQAMRWMAMGLLILLTLALMAAIWLPVRQGVSNDRRPRDALGLPMGEKPKPPPHVKK